MYFTRALLMFNHANYSGGRLEILDVLCKAVRNDARKSTKQIFCKCPVHPKVFSAREIEATLASCMYILIDEEGCEAEDTEDQGNDVDDEDEEDENEEEDDEDEEEEDDENDSFIIKKRATVFARWPEESKWEQVGLGTLSIQYDSEIYAERIVLKLDDSDEYASNTIISIDTVMEVRFTRLHLYKDQQI